MQPKTVHIITYASISRQFIFMQRPKVKGGVDLRRVFTLIKGEGRPVFLPQEVMRVSGPRLNGVTGAPTLYKWGCPDQKKVLYHYFSETEVGGGLIQMS